MSIGTNIEFSGFGTDKLHPLGTRIEASGGIVYRYIYNAGADTLAAGEMVGNSIAGASYGKITGTVADFQDGTSSTGVAVGMAVSAIPTTQYGWIQTAGPNQAAITSDGNVTAGDALGIAGTTSPDGTVLPIADGTEENVCGLALADDASTTLAVGSVSLSCERWW